MHLSILIHNLILKDRKRFVIPFLFPALMAGLAGCYPVEPGSLATPDAIITNYDAAYPFHEAHTYLLPDTIVGLPDPDHAENNIVANHAYDSLLLAQIAAHLDALGFERVYDTAVTRPDIGILLNTSAMFYWENYENDWHADWGWYPLWPAAYASGSGYQYPWPFSVDLTTGSLLVRMIDLKADSSLPTRPVKVIWMGAVDGLTQGKNIPERIQNSIQQLFDQSPCL